MKKTIRAIVLIMACLMVLSAFVSCGRSFDDVKAKAEKEGYTCTSATAEELKAISEHFDMTINNVLFVKGENADEFVTVYFFDAKSDAKDAFATIEESLKELNYTSSAVERKGKAVITGNSAMIEKIW